MAARAAILTSAGERCVAIVARAKGWYERDMEELFGHPAYTRFVLQDVKRLPARFFARLAGARLARTA